MEIHKLQQLLSEMSLQEKIGQMVQLTGVYFDKEAGMGHSVCRLRTGSDR